MFEIYRIKSEETRQEVRTLETIEFAIDKVLKDIGWVSVKDLTVEQVKNLNRAYVSIQKGSNLLYDVKVAYWENS